MSTQNKPTEDPKEITEEHLKEWSDTAKRMEELIKKRFGISSTCAYIIRNLIAEVRRLKK